MSIWKITLFGKKPKLKSPILITGLPGIGNVGKVATDFMIDRLKAKRLYDIFSYSFPHSVFVTEDNLVELPNITLYYVDAKAKRPALLLLGGDVQPMEEENSYVFSEKVLDLVQNLGCKEIITLGGIGLPTIPQKPRVYCTGNSKDMIKKYTKGTKVTSKLYGVVGPIIGVSGLLLGLSQKRKIKAVSLLAETYGHPVYLGIKGSREILKVLSKKLNLKLDIKDMDKEIDEIEAEMKKKIKMPLKAFKQPKTPFGEDVSYIG
jgi:uncharacterized protein (TIGR00162 family)